VPATTAAAGARASTRNPNGPAGARLFRSTDDAVAGVRPSYTFLLLLRSCTCARRDVGAETLVSGSAASRPPAHSASVRC